MLNKTNRLIDYFLVSGCNKEMRTTNPDLENGNI